LRVDAEARERLFADRDLAARDRTAADFDDDFRSSARRRTVAVV
jgi:hypothetical protein